MSLNSFVSMLDKKMCLLSLNSLDTRVSLMERSSVAESPTGTETALGWKIPMVTQGKCYRKYWNGEWISVHKLNRFLMSYAYG